VLVAKIHLAQGNGAEALRQYDLCSALFRTELGTEPTWDFTSLLPLSSSPQPPRGRALPAPPGRAFLARRSSRQSLRAPRAGSRPAQ
jgi:hypothetical protein